MSEFRWRIARLFSPLAKFWGESLNFLQGTGNSTRDVPSRSIPIPLQSALVGWALPTILPSTARDKRKVGNAHPTSISALRLIPCFEPLEPRIALDVSWTMTDGLLEITLEDDDAVEVSTDSTSTPLTRNIIGTYVGNIGESENNEVGVDLYQWIHYGDVESETIFLP